MRDLGQKLLAVIFFGAVFFLLAYMSGLAPDGLLNGKWSASDDHPTNWSDTALHP